MKRRNRYARLSGGQSKLTRSEGEEFVGKDGNYLRVSVGKVSFSKQVINTGRRLDVDVLQEYYSHVSAEKIADAKNDALIKELSVAFANTQHVTVHKITIFKDRLGSIELLCRGEECFFIELEDGVLIKRSRVYDRRRTAIDRYNNNRIAWVPLPE